MNLGTLIAIASAVWLLSCGASLAALYCNLKAGSQWRRPALIFSGAALLIGYLGFSRIQLHASRMVNGHLQWSVNSRWFFLTALVLGGAALALTLWNARKVISRRNAGDPAAP